jgi:holdfast attachment protein HfaA
MTRKTLRLATAAIALAALSGAAQAQSLSTSASAFNAGFGRVAGQENRGVDLDGRLTTLADSSLLPRGPIDQPVSIGGGVADVVLGAAEGGTTVVPADHLTVLTQGNWRTRSQASASASADASASVDLNGKIDLNGPN